MQVKECALKDETFFWFARSLIEHIENSPVEGEKGYPVPLLSIYIVCLGSSTAFQPHTGDHVRKPGTN